MPSKPEWNPEQMAHAGGGLWVGGWAVVGDTFRQTLVLEDLES